MPKTVYQRLRERKTEYGKKDIYTLGMWMNTRFNQMFGRSTEMIEQREGEKTYTVYAYPDEWVEEMDKVIGKYFANKKKRKREHEKRLKEAQERKAKKLRTATAVHKDKKSSSGNISSGGHRETIQTAPAKMRKRRRINKTIIKVDTR